ncbi:Probable aspartic protease At2g35615 [Linum perenne]
MEHTTNLITLFLLFFPTSSADHLKLITTRLIHRDSNLSPFHNATTILDDRATRMVEASLARHAYLSSISNDKPPSVEARMSWGIKNNVFYVNFSIGDPPVPQLALLDTGSGLLWLRCPPCKPYCSTYSGATFYYSFNSKTYSPRPCSKDCPMCTGPWLSRKNYCSYKAEYAGGQTSQGVFATEQLTFRTSDGGTATVPKLLFGCSTLETGYNDLDPRVNGILGLGTWTPGMPRGAKSLVTQLGAKFSYCVGRLSDVTYSHNHLSFGDAVDLAGDQTPFYLRDGTYFLQLLNISFGGQILDIKFDLFRLMSIRKGVVIDSGTELFFLYTAAYDVVKAVVKNLASQILVEVEPAIKPFELCYRGSVDREAKGFPMLGLHFVGGAELIMDNFGMFLQVRQGIFCLAIVRSEMVTVIGMMAQQGYNVGYDLNGLNVYFQNIDCQLLEG